MGTVCFLCETLLFYQRYFLDFQGIVSGIYYGQYLEGCLHSKQNLVELQNTEKEIVEASEEILRLLEFVACKEDDVQKVLRSFLINSCEKNLHILKKFRDSRPNMFDKSLVLFSFKSN